jgi:hypothetical protein
MLISLKEYAKKHGRELSGMRRKAIRCGFTTAVKVGRDWMIDEFEPLTDQRIKHGKYVNWRNKKQS